MGFVVPEGELPDASIPTDRHKGLLLDRTSGDPQEKVHPRNEKADADGSAASSAEARKSAHYARPGQVPFDKRSCKVTTVAAESFERLGKGGTEFVDQLVAGAIGAANGSNLRRKGVVKERFQRHVWSGIGWHWMFVCFCLYLTYGR